MMQKQKKIGPVAPCKGCGKQPRYYMAGSRLHFLECSSCGVRTSKHDTLQVALEQWEANERVNLTVRGAA